MTAGIRCQFCADALKHLRKDERFDGSRQVFERDEAHQVARFGRFLAEFCQHATHAHALTVGSKPVVGPSISSLRRAVFMERAASDFA